MMSVHVKVSVIVCYCCSLHLWRCFSSSFTLDSLPTTPEPWSSCGNIYLHFMLSSFVRIVL